MKIYISIFLILFLGQCKSQRLNKEYYLNLDSLMKAGCMRCGVAHINKDGIFQCDFIGHYYPDEIFDSSVRRWFIKMIGNDSLFYYRTDTVYSYIWNGRPKNEIYGYTLSFGGGSSETLPDEYNGSDTLFLKWQLWRAKAKN